MLDTQEPDNPGSFRQFTEEVGLTTDSLRAKRAYDTALATYRRQLAEASGQTPEQLHGRGATDLGRTALRLDTDSQAAA